MTQQRYYKVNDIPRTTELTERAMLPYPTLNYLLKGLLLDRVTLVISNTDAGKTTLVSDILCHIIKQGYKAFAFYGEDGGIEARDRLFKQYTPYGTSNFQLKRYIANDGKDTDCTEYFLTDNAWEKAFAFFADKLFIYNNNLPAKKDNLIETLQEAHDKDGCRIYIIDNAEMFDLDTDNENKGVKEIGIALRQFAIKNRVAVILVCHTRKVERDVIRHEIFDTKGTSALTNISKNIVTIIRTDRIDPANKQFKDLLKICEDAGYTVRDPQGNLAVDSILEVKKTKGRGLGVVCLRFNKDNGTYYECNKKSKGGDAPTMERPVIHKRPIQTEMVPVDDAELPF